MWIMKPAGLSRGRGIKVYKSLSKITEFFKNKDTPWVVMKYIENPLIIKTMGTMRKVLLLSSPYLTFLSSTSDNGCWWPTGIPLRSGSTRSATSVSPQRTTSTTKWATSSLIWPTTQSPNTPSQNRLRRLKAICGMSTSLMTTWR